MKKIIIFASITLLTIISVIVIIFVLNNNKNELIVTSYNKQTIKLGEYSIIYKDDNYLIKDKNKFNDEIIKSPFLYKKINDNNFIMYNDGYYFLLENKNNKLIIKDYAYKSGAFMYESFTLNNIVPNTKMTKSGYFYCYYKYNELIENDFNIKDRESLLNYYNSLNKEICIINDNEIKILIYSDINLGYEFKIEFDEEGFIAYEKNFS